MSGKAAKFVMAEKQLALLEKFVAASSTASGLTCTQKTDSCEVRKLG